MCVFPIFLLDNIASYAYAYISCVLYTYYIHENCILYIYLVYESVFLKYVQWNHVSLTRFLGIVKYIDIRPTWIYYIRYVVCIIFLMYMHEVLKCTYVRLTFTSLWHMIFRNQNTCPLNHTKKLTLRIHSELPFF